MAVQSCTAAYDLLRRKTEQAELRIINALTVGLTWVCCRANLAEKPGHPSSVGLAMRLGSSTRILPWSGTVAGRSTSNIAAWLQSWNTIEAAVGLAAVNASINTIDNELLKSAEKIRRSKHPNLAVFDYFMPQIKGQKVIVIGHYPGISEHLSDLDMTILERAPKASDLPDTAAELLLPNADWVFITASSLINKTFPRLAELAESARTVLMGPSTPWLKEWADFGIDYLAGIQVANLEKVIQIISEGGGTRLFDGGAEYVVAKISK